MKVLITGASGFVGSALINRLTTDQFFEPVAALRNSNNFSSFVSQCISLNDLHAQADWSSAFHDIAVVVHTAARVHVLHETSKHPEAEFKAVNTDGTLAIANQAASAGVKRFIFLSTAKVNGENSHPCTPFSPEDRPAPPDFFSSSKLSAECGLMQIANNTGMEVVIIRPPLVYGPHCKGNFASLIALISKSTLLPLGAINNRRSLIGIDNLVDFIVACFDHPAAANQTFLVSDGEDLSTTDLLKRMSKAMNKPSRLISVSPYLLEFGAKLLGKQAVAQHLLGSLQVDISKARNLLGWEPPVSVDEGLRRAVQNFDFAKKNPKN